MAEMHQGEPGAWQWVSPRSPLSRKAFKRIVIGAVSVLVVGVVAVVALAWNSDWDGSQITITNACGTALYLDDNYDGFTLEHGEALRLSHASSSGKKTIWLWRAGTPTPLPAGLKVNLTGDSVLSGPRCPK